MRTWRRQEVNIRWLLQLLSIWGIDSVTESAAHWFYSASLTSHQAPVTHPCLHRPSNGITAVWPPSQLLVSVLGIWMCICITTLSQLNRHPSLNSSSVLARARIKCPFSPALRARQQHVFFRSTMCAVSTLYPDSYCVFINTYASLITQGLWKAGVWL